MTSEQIKALSFDKVYQGILNKVQRKGYAEEQLHAIIKWLMGYEPEQVTAFLGQGKTYGEFFDAAPQWNPNRMLITGRICGEKVQEIQDPFRRDMRCLDKMVDELVHGKALDKIFRTPK